MCPWSHQCLINFFPVLCLLPVSRFFVLLKTLPDIFFPFSFPALLHLALPLLLPPPRAGSWHWEEAGTAMTSEARRWGRGRLGAQHGVGGWRGWGGGEAASRGVPGWRWGPRCHQ